MSCLLGTNTSNQPEVDNLDILLAYVYLGYVMEDCILQPYYWGKGKESKAYWAEEVFIIEREILMTNTDC